MEIKLRIVDKWKTHNNNGRSLFESVMSHEVLHSLHKWNNSNKEGVLIGGLALSYWCIPRYTQDVDILFLNKHNVPTSVDGFKKVRTHSFQCNDTHVEVEVLDSDFLKISQNLVTQVFKTSVISNGVKIASKSGLVALKLQRFSRQDQADIEALKNIGGIDLTIFDLTKKQLDNYDSIV